MQTFLCVKTAVDEGKFPAGGSNISLTLSPFMPPTINSSPSRSQLPQSRVADAITLDNLHDEPTIICAGLIFPVRSRREQSRSLLRRRRTGFGLGRRGRRRGGRRGSRVGRFTGGVQSCEEATWTRRQFVLATESLSWPNSPKRVCRRARFLLSRRGRCAGSRRHARILAGFDACAGQEGLTTAAASRGEHG